MSTSDSRPLNRSMISAAVFRRGNSPKNSSMYWISRAPVSTGYCLMRYSTRPVNYRTAESSGLQFLELSREKPPFGRGLHQRQGLPIIGGCSLGLASLSTQLGENGGEQMIR